jgi:hypothetical protein
MKTNWRKHPTPYAVSPLSKDTTSVSVSFVARRFRPYLPKAKVPRARHDSIFSTLRANRIAVVLPDNFSFAFL